MNRTYNIAAIPGDGTGPEVIREGRKVLDAAAGKYGFKLNYEEFDFGGDRYLRTGEILPESAPEELRKFDSIYLGAIGHPEVKPGILEKGILLRLRFELDQSDRHDAAPGLHVDAGQPRRVADGVHPQRQGHRQAGRPGQQRSGRHDVHL